MVSYVLNVDKAGDLKFGREKCRLHKKDEVAKVARDYGIPTPNKKTVKELCGSLKKKIQNAARVSNQIKKDLNNVPLAKLYPEAAKKQVAAKKRAEKKVFDRKVATNFLKTMVTNRIITPTRKVIVAVMPTPKPSKKAQPITKEEGIKRIKMMKNLNRDVRLKLTNRIQRGTMSPRKVVRVARELSRLGAPSSRVNL